MAKEDSLHFNTSKERCVRHLRNPSDVLNSLSNKATAKDYRYERLYRNLFNPNFYLLAYQNISGNHGSITPGIDNLTMDGMGMERINRIISKCVITRTSQIPLGGTTYPRRTGKSAPWAFRRRMTSWFRKLSVCYWRVSTNQRSATNLMDFAPKEAVTVH